jgi:hypothetical protein
VTGSGELPLLVDSGPLDRSWSPWCVTRTAASSRLNKYVSDLKTGSQEADSLSFS